MGKRIREAISQSNVDTALIGGRILFKKVGDVYTAKLNDTQFFVSEQDMPQHEEHVDFRKLSVKPLRT